MAAAAAARITPVAAGAVAGRAPFAVLVAVELLKVVDVLVKDVEELSVDEVDEVEVVDDAVELLVPEVLVDEDVVEEVLEGSNVAVSVPGPFAVKVVAAADWFARARVPELETHPEKL
jgi:hypothetical protein